MREIKLLSYGIQIERNHRLWAHVRAHIRTYYQFFKQQGCSSTCTYKRNKAKAIERRLIPAAYRHCQVTVPQHEAWPWTFLPECLCPAYSFAFFQTWEPLYTWACAWVSPCQIRWGHGRLAPLNTTGCKPAGTIGFGGLVRFEYHTGNSTTAYLLHVW